MIQNKINIRPCQVTPFDSAQDDGDIVPSILNKTGDACQAIPVMVSPAFGLKR
jgi:hypothetical protein